MKTNNHISMIFVFLTDYTKSVHDYFGYRVPLLMHSL